MKVVINACFGGFGLSDKAYEKLIKWGVPRRTYVKQEPDPKTHLYTLDPRNEGEIIFDRTEEDLDTYNFTKDKYIAMMGRYWETWIDQKRDHPLLIRVVEELGKEANGRYAELTVVEIPDDVKWHIHDYDGTEHVAENHRTWYGD